MKQRLADRLADRQVASDVRVVAGMGAIYCAGHHRDRDRAPLVSDASAAGAYGSRPPLLCEECAEHIRYAERRTAHCRQDPKPYCQHCSVHCYSPVEAGWQRQMMRYSGPRSIWRGYAGEALRHAIASAKWRRRKAREGTGAGRA